MKIFCLKWYRYSGHLGKSVIETKLLEVRYALAYPNVTALLLTVLLIFMIGRRKKMEKLVYSMGAYFQSRPRKAFVTVR